MLKNTFLHLSKIGIKSEQTLWKNGIHTWDDFFAGEEPLTFTKPRVRKIREELNESKIRLRAGDPFYFYERLPSSEHWRLFHDFRDQAAYLDIETTGLGSSLDHITTLAMFAGGAVHYYVHDVNMNNFLEDVKNYKILVTYNGRCFDIPFIEHEFKIKLPHAQIDLRYVLHSLGYKGGLKGCEKQLGIKRNELEGVDGYFAVLLWQEYKRTGNIKALETLLAYNIEDTVNLEKLMLIAYNKKIDKLQLRMQHFDENNSTPKPRFLPDRETIEAIKSRLYGEREFYL
jgi:uncharacterized protein YprB with RNaseH-like and TPR domain